MTWVSGQYPGGACEFSYENACSGFYDVLDFPPFTIEDSFEAAIAYGNNGMPPKMHFKEFEDIGDSPSISPELTEYIPYGQPDGQLLGVEDYFDGEILVNDMNSDDDLFWGPDVPSEVVPATPDTEELKIRYTRQYLLNLKRSPLSKVFPECLLKYLHSGELPLKRKKPKVRYDRKNVDHIMFYRNLPYAKTKYPPGSSHRNSPSRSTNQNQNSK